MLTLTVAQHIELRESWDNVFDSSFLGAFHAEHAMVEGRIRGQP